MVEIICWRGEIWRRESKGVTRNALLCCAPACRETRLALSEQVRSCRRPRSSARWGTTNGLSPSITTIISCPQTTMSYQQEPTVVSASGKVLLAGGYLVLDQKYSGVVVSTSSRFYTMVESTASGKAGMIVVRSPQFVDAEWAYRVAIENGQPVVSKAAGCVWHWILQFIFKTDSQISGRTNLFT